MTETLQTVNRSKVEQNELIFPSDPDPLFEGYFDEIKEGKFRPRTDADVAKVISLEFSAKPITPLTDWELKKLEDYLRRKAESSIWLLNEDYQPFAEHELYLIDNELIELIEKQINIKPRESGLFRMPVFLDSTKVKHNSTLLEILKIIKNLNISPLKPEELIGLLMNPETIGSFGYVDEQVVKFLDGSIEHYGGRTTFGDGSRHLFSHTADVQLRDDYNYSNAEDFKNKLERIRQRTKKLRLTMLDIGGNFGKALMDAKKIDPTLKTINMTLNYLPSINGDIIVRRPAEYMPAVFEETIDVIESNYAFTYFLFPDIGLINAVKALSVGGEANLSFSNNRCPLDKEELLERMKKVFTWLKDLEQKGYIEIARIEGYDPFLVETAQFGRQLQITKKKSTQGL